MMHKWESTEKLLPEWESQPHGEDFQYNNFEYKKDEFDNVPPIVPRFLFYLQLNLKPVCQFTKEFVQKQTTASLKQEVQTWRQEDKVDLDNRENAINKRQDELNKRCDILQAQIDQINELRNAEALDRNQKAKQSLYEDQHFKFLEAETLKSQFEKPTANYLDSMSNEAWQEPRMYTLQQLRNTFYALTHQSIQKYNLDQTMIKTENLQKETIRLDVVDKQLDFNIKDVNNSLKKFITANYDEFQNHCKDNALKHSDARRSLEKHSETLTSHKSTLDDLKRSLQSTIDNGSRTAARLEKTKENLQDEIARTRDEIYVKIDFNDRFCIEQFDLIKNHSSKDRNTFQNAMNELRDQLQGEMHTESDQIKSYVLQITNRASAHRETLQEKYDEKLDKIKDVCAQYFSKYEKHLMNQQEIVKGLEKRQEDWVNTLIKPQELNQARLFSIDTRIKEQEMQRTEDNQFYKDTIKKLIFALEQHQGSAQRESPVAQQTQQRFSPTNTNPIPFSSEGPKRPPKSQRTATTAAVQSRSINMTRDPHQRMSVADQQFGQPQQAQNQLVLYPQHQNGALLPVIAVDENKKQPLSFMDLRLSTSGEQNYSSQPTTNDILYLKRLLFLKATLDNQV